MATTKRSGKAFVQMWRNSIPDCTASARGCLRPCVFILRHQCLMTRTRRYEFYVLWLLKDHF